VTTDLYMLILVAASVAFVHTLSGPDHYLPFIAMARASRWSMAKAAWVTLLCGLGHVASSVFLGVVGIAAVLGVDRLVAVEGFRADLAAWGMIGFGLVYLVWGLRKAARGRPHEHWHAHVDGRLHRHMHLHAREHVHVHAHEAKPRLTPWILFTLFLFGPCEPMIPILMYPALAHSRTGVVLVTLVFATVTLATMLAVVLSVLHGARRVRLGSAERYAHALAGGAVLGCGVAMKFLGL